MSIQTATVGLTPTTVYTSVGGSAITFMSLCNFGTNDVTCNVYVVPNGDVPSDSNIVIKDLEILAGDTYILYQGGEKILLDGNDSVVVSSSIGNTVSVVTSFAGGL